MVQLLLNSVNDEAITSIARICHEMNRHLCVHLGDKSQAPWKDTPAEIKKSAINGVRFALSNNFPTPEAMHENWVKEKLADGWKYGEEKSIHNKTHPCIVPYDELPEEQQFKDWLFRSTILSMLTLWSGSPQMGPQIPPLPYEPEPEPEPEPETETETETETNRDDVDVVDDSSEEVVTEESAGEATESGGEQDDETSEESSSEDSPEPKKRSRKKK
jgi:hypothetical protein